MEVRPATIADAPALARVHVAAWRAAYAGVMSDAYLAGLDEARFARGWESALGDGTTFVGISDGGRIDGFATAGAARDDDAPCTGQLWVLNLHPDRHLGPGSRPLCTPRRLDVAGRRWTRRRVLVGGRATTRARGGSTSGRGGPRTALLRRSRSASWRCRKFDTCERCTHDCSGRRAAQPHDRLLPPTAAIGPCRGGSHRARRWLRRGVRGACARGRWP